MIEAVANYSAPDIFVSVGGIEIPNRGTLDLGTADLGAASPVRTVTVRNLGGEPLTISSFALGQFTRTLPSLTTLAPGQFTTMDVALLTSSAGAQSGLLSISSNDSDESPYSINLSGLVAVPEISVLNSQGVAMGTGSGSEFIYVPLGESAVRTFVIQNTGTGTLTLQNPTWVYSEGPHILGPLSATSVPPGGSASFTITFNPTVGWSMAQVSLPNNDPNENPYTITFQVIVQYPSIVVEYPVGTRLSGTTTTSASMGTQTVGSPTDPQVFTISNEGETILHLTGLLKSGTAQGDYSVSAFSSATVRIGGTATFSVVFNPTTTGTRRATLEIDSDSSSHSAFQIPLTGSGVRPQIVVQYPTGVALVDNSVTGISFGSQLLGGDNVAKTVTILNTGAGVLNLGAVGKDGSNPSDFLLGSLSSTVLAHNESATFTVTFAPTATSARSAAIHIASNDFDDTPFDIHLSGTAVAPEIAIEDINLADVPDGASLDFGAVPEAGSSVKTFHIYNHGTYKLTLNTAVIDGANPFAFTVSPFSSTSLAPGESTDFTITFAPNGLGSRSAGIHISNNDSDEGVFDLSVRGSGYHVNLNPLAPEQIFTRGPGLTLKIPIADIVAGCSDPDGGSVSFITIGSSARGASMARSSTYIFYSLGPDVNDSFGYTITDGQGGMATGTIRVNVVDAGGQIQSIAPGAGGVTLTFAGIPGISYGIQRATDPAGPWSTLSTITAPPNGVFDFTDPSPPPAGYYRLTHSATP